MEIDLDELSTPTRDEDPQQSLQMRVKSPEEVTSMIRDDVVSASKYFPPVGGMGPGLAKGAPFRGVRIGR